MDLLSCVPDYLGRLLDLPVRVDSLRKAGLLDPMRPDEGLRSLLAVRKFGPLAGAANIAAQRDGHAIALIDELGPLTFDQLDRRSNALARAWEARGVRADSVIAVLARDHRGLLDCMLAAAKIGARLLLMNTGFSKPQLTAVVARESVAALAFDQEFADLLGDVPADVPRYLSWLDDADTAPADVPKLDELIASTTDTPVPAPPKPGGLVLLTSGTTGTPKGAPRHVTGVLGATHFVERIPLRVGGATFIASPMFHATGLSQLILSLALGTTVVVRRRFKPEETLRELAENHCTGMVAVPTQLARILDLGEDVLSRYDTSSLRTIITAGSLLPPDVSNRAIHAFGPVLYNLYGSTEVAVASIATPEELLAAPGHRRQGPARLRGPTLRQAGQTDHRRRHQGPHLRRQRTRLRRLHRRRAQGDHRRPALQRRRRPLRRVRSVVRGRTRRRHDRLRRGERVPGRDREPAAGTRRTSPTWW